MILDVHFEEENLDMDVGFDEQATGGGGTGTSDYNDLANKPSINSVPLSGNKTSSQLGLASASDIPTKVSDLQNDSGFVDSTGAAEAAPVQSVNSKTGTVTLTQDDVGDGSTYVRTHNDYSDADKTAVGTISGKQAKISASGILKGDGDGGVSAAVAGTDYEAPLGITSATAGQYVKIKTVDSSGNPTAYEAGTPSGGGGGVSPEVTITEITGGHRVTITDEDHPSGQSFDVMDGEDGADGQDGSDGADGADGEDGVSPGVAITEITGGHTVTITDADHPNGQSFNVMDGATGQTGQTGPAGPGVPSGGSDGWFLVKDGSTDYATKWLHLIFPADYSSYPAMDGTASPGSSTKWARGDHVHPTDTSRQASITATGILKGAGSGSVGAAVAGTDYQTPLTAGTDYQTPVKLATVTLLYNGWGGSGPWTQTAVMKDANDQTITPTANTKVDVQPDATALGQLIAAGVKALYISNSSGTLTAYAVGAQPAHSSASDNIVLQVTYYETTT